MIYFNILETVDKFGLTYKTFTIFLLNYIADCKVNSKCYFDISGNEKMKISFKMTRPITGDKFDAKMIYLSKKLFFINREC